MTRTRMDLLPGRNGAWHPRRFAPPISELHGHRPRLTPLQPAPYPSPTPAPAVCRATGRPPTDGPVTASIDRYLPARRSPPPITTPGTDRQGPTRRWDTAARNHRLLRSQ